MMLSSMTSVTSHSSPWGRKQANFVSAAIDDQECKAEDRRLQERIQEALDAPEGRLRLYINNMRCGGSLTDDVCRIKTLRELYCHDNVRLERLPASLHHLGATLQVIDASRCNLVEVPEGLSQLRFLKHLSLAGNKLKTFVWDCTPFIRYPDDPYPMRDIPSSDAQVLDNTSRLAPKWRTRQTDPPALTSQGKVRFRSTGGRQSIDRETILSDEASDDAEFKFWGIGEDGPGSAIASPATAALRGNSTSKPLNAPARDRHRYLSMNYRTGKLDINQTAPTRSRVNSVGGLLERFAHLDEDIQAAPESAPDNSNTISAPTDGWVPAAGKPFTSLEFLDLSGNEIVYLSPSALQLVEVLLDRSAWRMRNSCAGSATVKPAVLLLPNPHLLQPAGRVLTGNPIAVPPMHSSPSSSPMMGGGTNRSVMSSYLPSMGPSMMPTSDDPYRSLIPSFVSRCCMCQRDLHVQGVHTYVHFTPMTFPSAATSIARQERECETLGGVPPQFTNGAEVLPDVLHATHGASGHITTDRQVLFGRRAMDNNNGSTNNKGGGSYASSFYANAQQRQVGGGVGGESSSSGSAPAVSCMVRVPTFFPLCSTTDCHMGLYARLQTAGTSAADIPTAVFPLE